MSNIKIKDLKTLVKTKFVGLYDVEFLNKNNEDRHWMVASRKSEEELRKMYLENKEDKIDAVVIAALHKTENKLVIIKQFRVPINKYIYELPAGLVDSGENMETTVKRELKEETGLDLISINKENSKQKVYLSPGMTDESVDFVYCICDGILSDEYLEDDEDIQAILVSQDEAIEILKGNDTIDIKSYLMLQMFANLGDKLFY
ncbi:MAG: NUDIX hydrolase [Peptostreptococcaceae bacterium]